MCRWERNGKTALPILMLGGPAREDPSGTISDFHKGMQAGPNIRGAMVGRNVTFCYNDDPLAAALAVTGVIHKGMSVGEAIARLMDMRGSDCDAITRHVK